MARDLILKTIIEKSKDPWWKESERKVIDRYRPIFNPSNLDNLTKEDFKSFLLIKNNLHWEGIHRQENIITSDMGKLIVFLKKLLDESMPIEQRLKELFNKKGHYTIKGLGKAVVTPILLVVYPNKYGVWNSRSESALKKLNLFPQFRSKDDFANKYIKVNDVLKELKSKYQINFWQLDGILGEVSGSGPFETSVENKIEEDAKEYGISDVETFGLEKHLEDFIIDNWDKTIFGKKYDLIEEDGEVESKQYPTSSGPIDILVKSKDGNEYLVIELKKGRTSDAVVGQILRYMTWVKENLTDKKVVKGAIIVLDSDENLKLSLRGSKQRGEDISLYTYKVLFNLNK